MTRREIYSIRNERILYVTIWVAVSLLPIVLELWKDISGTGFSWKFVFHWWIAMLPLILIFLLHNHILIRKYMKKGKLGIYILTVILLVGAYGGLQYAVNVPPVRKEVKERVMPPRQQTHEIRPHDPGHKPPRPFPVPFPILFKLMLAVMTLGINVAISMIFTYAREQIKRDELESRRLKDELKYLKQQISPHFFMNVLNNIHEMMEEDTKEAQDMVLELSYLMRYVLYESEKEMTSLESEFRFISSYIALMKRRYVEGIVNVRLDLPVRKSSFINVPPLLFISFIENAFKHGVSYKSGAHIDISINETGNKIFFNCKNSIPEEKCEIKEGGVGLSNVQRRLDLLYGDEYSLSIDKNDNEYSVILIIPCR